MEQVMENDVTMWACLKALGANFAKFDYDDAFFAYFDLYEGKRVSAVGETIYEAAKNLYAKVLNLKATEL